MSVFEGLLDHLMRQGPGDPDPLPRRPGWQDDAACRGVGVEVFHDRRHVEQALALCASCAVTEPCKQMALANPLGRPGRDHEVWAGLTADQLVAEQAEARPQRRAGGCRRGHVWATEDDVYVAPDGGRTCRRCLREGQPRRRAERRSTAALAGRDPSSRTRRPYRHRG